MLHAESPSPSLIVNITGPIGSGVSTGIRELRKLRPDIAAVMGVLDVDEALQLDTDQPNFPLSSQLEYANSFADLSSRHPDAILGEVEKLTTNNNLVLIDGLRSFTEAKKLKNNFPDTYHTLVLDCPRTVRYLRFGRFMANDTNTPEHLRSVARFAADEQAALSLLHFDSVVSMQNLADKPLNTQTTKQQVAQAIASILGPKLGLDAAVVL